VATISKTARGETRYCFRYRTPDRRQTDKRGFRTKRDAEQFAAAVEVAKMRRGVHRTASLWGNSAPAGWNVSRGT
jgi:hypothetical protein